MNSACKKWLVFLLPRGIASFGDGKESQSVSREKNQSRHSARSYIKYEEEEKLLPALRKHLWGKK